MIDTMLGAEYLSNNGPQFFRTWSTPDLRHRFEGLVYAESNADNLIA